MSSDTKSDTDFYRYTADGYPSRSYRALNVTRAAITRSKKYRTIFPEYKVQKLMAALSVEPGVEAEDITIAAIIPVLEWVDIDG